MISIDAVIESLPTMSESKRAIWAANATRMIARGPRRNAAYAPVLRLRDAIAAFEATRPDENALMTTSGLDWDRVVAGRTTFRGFAGARLVARFTAQVNGETLARAFATLSAARVAAAEVCTADVWSSAPLAHAA